MTWLGCLLLDWTTNLVLVAVVVVKLLIGWSTILAICDHLVCYGLSIDRDWVTVHIYARTRINLTTRYISDKSLVLRCACHRISIGFLANLASRWQSMVQFRNVYWVFTTELFSLVASWLIRVIVWRGLRFVAGSDLAKFTLAVDVSVALQWGRPRHFKL